MARNNVYLYYRNTQRHETQVRKLIDVGTRYGLNVVQDHRQANIIVSIGGDGAFLQAARF
ncbi:MAG TPA: NAD kinase, partial [Exiguobacterium sp.]|nr:NAD kinase [Exiguobacterium sp.]